MAENDRISQEMRLVLCLASGATIAEAATRCGMSERTVYRRLHEASFCQLVQQARDDMFDRLAGLLSATASKAVERLCALLDDGNSHIRLGACRAVLDFTLKVRAQEHLARDMQARQQQLQEQGLLA